MSLVLDTNQDLDASLKDIMADPRAQCLVNTETDRCCDLNMWGYARGGDESKSCMGKFSCAWSTSSCQALIGFSDQHPETCLPGGESVADDSRCTCSTNTNNGKTVLIRGYFL